MPTLLTLLECIAKGRGDKITELRLFGPNRENLHYISLCQSLQGHFYELIGKASASQRFYARGGHTEELAKVDSEHKYHVILVQNKSEFRWQKLVSST